MDTYLRRKKDMLFRNVQSLQTVDDLLNDIDKKLGLPHKEVTFSKTPEVLAAIFGVGSGIALSCLFLYISGSVLGFSPEGIASALKAAGAIVGGNDTVGIFMIMLPIIILGGIGFHRARLYRDLRLKESKIYFYKRALAKQALLKNVLFKTQNAYTELVANAKAASAETKASAEAKVSEEAKPNDEAQTKTEAKPSDDTKASADAKVSDDKKVSAEAKVSDEAKARAEAKANEEAKAQEQAEKIYNLKRLYSAIQKVIRDIKHDLGIVQFYDSRTPKN